MGTTTPYKKPFNSMKTMIYISENIMIVFYFKCSKVTSAMQSKHPLMISGKYPLAYLHAKLSSMGHLKKVFLSRLPNANR